MTRDFSVMRGLRWRIRHSISPIVSGHGGAIVLSYPVFPQARLETEAKRKLEAVARKPGVRRGVPH